MLARQFLAVPVLAIVAAVPTAVQAPTLSSESAAGPAAQGPHPLGASAYLYTCVFEAYAGNYDELAGELEALGLGQVRLSTKPQNFATDSAYVQEVKDFNRALHARGIEVAALFLQSPTLLQDPVQVASRTNAMLDFNAGGFGSIAPEEVFDALDCDVEPMQDPSWGTATWPEKDVLVQELLDNVVSVVRQNLDAAFSDLPLSVAVGHFFHDRVNLGDLSAGKVDDFLHAGADVVSVFAYDDDLDGILSKLSEEVLETTTPRSIEVVLKTKNDGNDDQTFFEEGCLALRTTVFELLMLLDALTPSANVRPVVSVFEVDSLRQICLPGAPTC